VLIALAISDDAQNQKAINALSELSEPVGIPNAVLTESARILWNLTKDSRFIASWCQDILSRFQIVCEKPDLITNALGRYAQNSDRLSLVDCEVIEWNKTSGFSVLSFDDDLNRELAKD